jgi:NAD-dependent dihydropyrimidine dehydrogenase PreA subunit
MIELPLVEVTRCSRCTDCVVVCPTNCLSMMGALPYLARPADCISCGLCVLVCPSAALSLVDAAAA